MLINIHCAKCVGIEAVPVTVEVDITTGLGIHLVGLADVAVKESLLRTITALQSMGWYSQQESKVLLIVARKHEMTGIVNEIKEIDKNAFILCNGLFTCCWCVF